jgi:chemotaxis protein CheZ
VPPAFVNPELSAGILKPTADLGTAMPTQRKVFRIEESGHASCAVGEISVPAPQDETLLRHHELMTEITALRALLAPRPEIGRKPIDGDRGQVIKAHELKSELDLIHEAIRRTKQEMGGLEGSAYLAPKMARVGLELDAVVAGTEKATQNILKEAEDIDQIANTLSFLVKGEYAIGLAQDMHDHVVKIFEACNFQDLTGQRISKVVTTLKFIEDHIIRMQGIWSSLDSSSPAAFSTQAAPGPRDRAPEAPAKNAGSTDAKFLNGPKLADDPGHSTQADIDRIFDSN